MDDDRRLLDDNRRIIEEFRANGGVVSGQVYALLLLTTTGARSGRQRTAPLAYARDGDHYIILGSKGGGPTNPAWYHNLVAHPEVTVEVGREQFQAQARVPEGAERERLYNETVVKMPEFARYQRNMTRRIPVVVLARIEE
jgi:deazaflavin-dependent oxidoreductase (nitroreductase family)